MMIRVIILLNIVALLLYRLMDSVLAGTYFSGLDSYTGWGIAGGGGSL